jgi:hypothetical protein
MPREINNIGEPLRAPDGTPLGGVKITWVLCTSKGFPIDALDVDSRERYFPIHISAVTSRVDTDDLKIGEFKRPGLWPTSRADRQVFYKCSATAGMRDFIAPLVEGDTPLKFSDFAASGAHLEPSETSGFAQHLQDNVRHVTFADRARWDAGGGGGSTAGPMTSITGSDGFNYQLNIIDTGRLYLQESPMAGQTPRRKLLVPMVALTSSMLLIMATAHIPMNLSEQHRRSFI